MRIAAQVFLAYALVLLLGCLWRRLPLTGHTTPDVVALTAVYLGLTARDRLSPPTLGAVILGYLADLLSGTPRGTLSFTAGIICILGHLIHRRLIVRGWIVTLAVSFFTGLAAGFVGLCLRGYAGLVGGSMGSELSVLLSTAALTAVAGPLIFRLCRTIDARFARTYRERDAIEGFSP